MARALSVDLHQRVIAAIDGGFPVDRPSSILVSARAAGALASEKLAKSFLSQGGDCRSQRILTIDFGRGDSAELTSGRGFAST
jgi:hypothetical protein